MSRINFFFIFLFLFFPLPVLAKSSPPPGHGPLTIRSQNPLSLQHLSPIFERPQILVAQKFFISIATAFSNIFEYRSVGPTTVDMDMELWRSTLTFAKNLGSNSDLRLDIPFHAPSGGFLDAFVQGYHNLFGFPNSGRETVANNRFNFSMAQGGANLINYSRSPFGLGDLSLRIKTLLPKKINPFIFPIAFSVWTKLPTGTFTNGASSGHPDLGFFLHSEQHKNKFHFYQQFGVVSLWGHRELENLQRPFAFHYAGGVEWQVIEDFSIISQLQGHTGLFTNNNINAGELSGSTLDLIFGVSGSKVSHLSQRRYHYQVGFSEDLLSRGPSVDFTFFVSAGIEY